MSQKSIEVKILFSSSKTLHPKMREAKFDKYRIYSVPTIHESLTDTHENVILEFFDLWEESQMSSYPEKEGDYVLSLLSLILQMKVEIVAIKENNVQGTIRSKRSSYLGGTMVFPPDLEDLFKKLHSLDTKILKQYLRSCDVYRTALSLIDTNPTLSFFLLVTAIECISNVVIESGSSQEKFKKFIVMLLPSSFKDELKSEELLLKLIDQAYKMRSAFAHGGKEISLGTLSADKMGKIYVRHHIDKEEIVSPSLKWFENVVRNILIEFLRNQGLKEKIESKLSNLAREEAIIYVKAKRPIEVGKVVFEKDVDLE